MNEFIQSRKRFLVNPFIFSFIFISKLIRLFFYYFDSWLEQIESDRSRTIHLVIGNESCDLDSAVSAIAYAYLLQASFFFYCNRWFVV